MLLSMLRDRTRGLFASNDIQAPPGADVHYLHMFFYLLKINKTIYTGVYIFWLILKYPSKTSSDSRINTTVGARLEDTKPKEMCLFSPY